MKDKGEGKFRKFFKKVGAFLDNLLFPSNIKCIFCGDDIPDFDNKPYCESCEKEIRLNSGNKCLICAEPIDNEATVCDHCQKNKRFFKKAFCPFVYEGKVRSAILGYKSDNQRYKAKAFAKMIADDILKSGVKIDLITFVPLTKKKEKERTFNQSKLLAEELAKILNKEVVSLFTKVKDGKAQKFSTYNERQEKMKGLYTLNKFSLKKDCNILIVDDIITTCATVNYCSSLICNKVSNVYVCAVARNKLKAK